MHAESRPNFLFILADDLGYGGLHCYGNDWVETPNIDRLCSEGMKFVGGYSSHPTCQPSRIAILSGQYAPRTGGYRVTDHHKGKEHLIKYIVPELTGLALEKVTFAEQFKANGYTTAMYGKWHADNYKKDLHPRYQGFDIAYACASHYDASRCDPEIELPGGMDFAELFTGMAVEFMENAVKDEKPFFLYMPYFLVHAPFETRQDYVDHFTEKLKGINLTDRNADRVPIYAAMTRHLDDCVGRLLQAIENLGIEGETVIIFTSDNGSYSPDLVGGYRGSKGDVYEGGMRVPYIFKWHGIIAEESVSEERITHIDLYPTFLELAGLDKPDGHVLDGLSIAPILTGKATAMAERSIVCYYPKYAQFNDKTREWRTPWRNVIFDGDYKLREVVEYGTYELYDLVADPLEIHDMADRMPEKVEALKHLLQQWKTEFGVDRLVANPDYALD